jgi:hypothetical protein
MLNLARLRRGDDCEQPMSLCANLMAASIMIKDRLNPKGITDKTDSPSYKGAQATQW